MNSKIIGTLIVAAVVGLGAAVYLAPSATQTEERSGLGEPFFPELRSQLGDISRIELRDSSNTTTLIRDSDAGWQIAEADQYPANGQAVARFLQSAVDANRMEEKTSNPARYTQVDVEDVAEGTGKGRLFRLFAADGTELAALITGQVDVPQAGTGGTQQFVRVPGETASWTISPTINVNASRQNWFGEELFTIASNRVRTAEVRHPDGEIVRTEKANKDDRNWVLTTIPEGREVASEWQANELAGALNGFALEDVRTRSFIPEENAPLSVYTATTFDGLQIIASVFEHDAAQWTTFQAIAPTEAAEGVDLEALAEEAKTINQRSNGWVFRVPKFTLDRLTRRNEFFLSRPIVADEETGPMGPQLPSEFELPIGSFREENRLIDEPNELKEIPSGEADIPAIESTLGENPEPAAPQE